MEYIDPALEDGAVMLLQRHIENIPYVANTLVTAPAIRLRPNLIKNIIIHVSATFSTQGGGTLVEDFPWRLIRHITVRSVRNEVLKTFVPRAMNWLNTYETGTPEYSTFPAVIGPGVVVNAEFDLCIPFDDRTGIKPENTVLNLNEFTELYVDFLWADIQDAYLDGFDDITVTATMVILEREPTDMRDELTPRPKLIDQTYVLPIQTTELEYLLPENTLIKTLLCMLTFDSTNQRIPPLVSPLGIQDPIINLSIEDDDNAHSLREWSGNQIRSSNKSYYGLETIPGGIYVVEFDKLRDFTTLYKTFGRNYPKIKLTLNPTFFPHNASTLTLFIRQVATPPRIAVPI